ncbi:hypothetical protein WA026_019579 [Henosepilachna vigintioctopunctata]|uniref:Uncharacterized protein n=1 Tax=Henosepilachna vigintioctopunctata TaxID=420089 RepID=A0AAW1TXB4_9CUCU
MEAMFEKIMQKFAEQEKRREQEKLEKEQRRLEKERRRQQQRQEDKQHSLNMVTNWGQQNKGKLQVELGPVKDECRSELIPGSLDNVMMGLDQNMVDDDRQGMDMKNRKEEGPEKGDSDVTDVADVMSNRGRKLTNPEQLNDYKVSSAYYLKKQSVRKV